MKDLRNRSEGGAVARPPLPDRVITPLALFVCFYFASFWIAVWSGLSYFQWVALGCACSATAATVVLWHHGRWDLGLSPRFAPRELAIGAAFAAVLIGSADLLILTLTPSSHLSGSGFPWRDVVALFIPGALHEELVFRGYPYQIVRQFNRPLAVVGSSLVFAALHGWNSDITALALINIFLGGVILALAYERYRRLWMPIGLHFAWNMLSGPVLGYDVSGITPGKSLFAAVVQGPAILNGGEFGIEGSIILTAMELAAALLLWKGNEEFRISN